ncbi:DUF6153 family protein [Streptomyces sp. NPDC005805]|uniref:DUF6153 family protein n=1 Tax=Streptomyces sp. NPDC005805 TaxID=3157068 RepID=UPI0033E70412
MRRQSAQRTRSSRARARVLLVLAVLAGVLAMHGLASGTVVFATPHTLSGSASATPAGGTEHAPRPHRDPSPAPTEPSAHPSHPSPGAGHADPVAVSGDAHHDRAATADAHGAGAGGHVDHADRTCAASGLGAAPVLPALPLVGADGRATAAEPPTAATGACETRAPPSLSRLQLLRI